VHHRHAHVRCGGAPAGRPNFPARQNPHACEGDGADEKDGAMKYTSTNACRVANQVPHAACADAGFTACRMANQVLQAASANAGVISRSVANGVLHAASAEARVTARRVANQVLHAAGANADE